MFLRSTLSALALTGALALPAAAIDLDNMSTEEREAFGDAVRGYLLENPQVIMEAVAVLEEREQQAQLQADLDLVQTHKEALFNDGHSWEGGNPEGDITLVEFLDYSCGFCKRAFPEVEQLVEMDGNIRLIIKEFPILGPESEYASRFALATREVAGDDAYKAVHDALMTLTGPKNEATLSRLAEPLGLDFDAITAQMDSEAVTDILEKNRALATALQINGTPSFVMETEMLRGYVPLDGMLQIADTIRETQ